MRLCPWNYFRNQQLLAWIQIYVRNHLFSPLFLFVLLSWLLYLGLASGLVQQESLQTIVLAELERTCGVRRTIHGVRRSIQEGGGTRRREKGSHVSQWRENSLCKKYCNQTPLQSWSIFKKAPEQDRWFMQKAVCILIFFLSQTWHESAILSDKNSPETPPLSSSCVLTSPGVKEG